MKFYDKCFVTGCDSNTEWMLPWFLKNFKKHNDLPILLSDFGMTSESRQWAFQMFDEIIDVPKQSVNGWFLKPKTLMSVNATETFWIDTDIHVLGNLSDIFSYLQTDKLTMVEDRPWSLRTGEKWHNSGVIGIRGKPDILSKWAKRCMTNPTRGDQEVLHDLVKKSLIIRDSYITDLPNIYNWLRIQLLDGQDSPDKLCMHYTGSAGKDKIRKLIYNE